MVKSHTMQVSTPVLVQEWGWAPGNESEDCAIVLGSAMGAKTNEISEALLRVGMDPIAPIPLCPMTC